ncbi:MAG: hypothetical protein WCR83_07220 [Candidatus Methanomethylophilaceae archaeon]
MFTASTDEKITEPVNLEGLKAYLSLREEDGVEDSYLNQLIMTARSRLEEYLETVIAVRSFELEFDSGYWHELYRPLTSVDLITYKDPSDVEHEIEDYETVVGNKAIVGFEIPEDLKEGTSVKVAFTSGMEECPTSIVLGIKMMCKEMYSRSGLDPLTDDVKKIVQSEVIYDL